MELTLINTNAISISDSTVNLDEQMTTNHPVDISVLSSFDEGHTEGEPSLVVELIDLFLDDAPKRLRAMSCALLDADLQSVQRTAHSLKGSCSSLGATQMAALCNELESATSRLPFQEMYLLLVNVEREFESVRLVFGSERLKRM